MSNNREGNLATSSDGLFNIGKNLVTSGSIMLNYTPPNDASEKLSVSLTTIVILMTLTIL